MRVWLLWLAMLGLGCAAPPDLRVGRLQARLVVDPTVHTFIESYEVAVLRALTSDERSVGCEDFPAKFDLGDEALQLEAFRSIAWDGSATEATVEGLTVPVSQPLLIVVRAFDGNNDDALIVARGCKEDLRFTRGSSPQRAVDVRAATGAPCSSSDECEQHLDCQQDTDLPGGYCAQAGCSSNDDCPTASVCIEGGLCARPCSAGAECEGKSSQQCVSRQSVEGGCEKICVFPDWNAANSC